MNRIKFIEESIAEKRAALVNITEKLDNEARAWNDEEKAEFKSLKSEIEDLNDELRELKELEAEKKEAAKKKEAEARKAEEGTKGFITGEKSTSEADELLKLSRKFNLAKAIRHAAGMEEGTGVEKELSSEARKEARSNGANYGYSGIGIPGSVIKAEWEARTDISQTTSGIQPTVVGSYVDAIRQKAVFSQVIPASNILNGLTADYKIPAVGSQSLAWATAENSAAADGGANFSKDTLAPVRLTGYADISNRVLLQNGEAAMMAVMADFGRETANKIDAALFSTTDVTNAIPSIAGTSDVLTFTEAATYAASSSTVNGTIFDDYLAALQTLANGDVAPTAFVGSSKLMSDLRKSPGVIGVTSAVSMMSGGAPLRLDMGEGVPFYLTTSNTSNGTTSADFIGGDFNFCYVGFFGGLDISIDPYSVKLNDQQRVVVHRHVDASAIRGAGFVKATSLLS